MEECIQQLMDGDMTPLIELYGPCFSSFAPWACTEFECCIEEVEAEYKLAVEETCRRVLCGEITHFTHGIKAYVKCCARNRLINLKKHQKVHLKFAAYQRHFSETSLQNEAETRMNDGHFNALLKRCLKKLKPREQYMFQLYYFEHREQEEIAAMMNYSNTDSVRNKISSILEKLGKWMRESGEL